MLQKARKKKKSQKNGFFLVDQKNSIKKIEVIFLTI
jgi:hypothetical protein